MGKWGAIFLIVSTLCCTFGYGLEQYYDHIDRMKAIEQGYSVTYDNHGRLVIIQQ